MRYEDRENCGKGCSQIVDERGNYSSTIFARESIRIIQEHDAAIGAATENGEQMKPLFLVLSYQAVHSPVQVPERYRNMYANKTDWSNERKLYGAMCAAADDSLGDVIDAMKKTKLWDDTLIIYTSDNGAPFDVDPTGGSNHPLKRGKAHVW